MEAKPRSRGHDALVAIATVVPVFVIVAFFSTLEKALIAATVFGAMWVAVSERWHERGKHGFWLVVSLFAVVNAIAFFALPTLGPFKAGLTVAYPLGMGEGFLLYWLLGRLRKS